jgi:hypothetical protein
VAANSPSRTLSNHLASHRKKGIQSLSDKHVEQRCARLEQKEAIQDDLREKVQQRRSRNLDRQARRILSAISSDDPPPKALQLAVHGWLAFVIATTLRWLDSPTLSREQLRELCVRTLFAAIETE